MKIGLFSPHYAYNYGAVLQAFALKTYLRRNGYDAYILNRRPEYQCAIPSLLGRLARKLEEYSKETSFGIFEKRYLQPQTERIVLQSDWQRFPDIKLDAVIVGSDQIWRDDYTFNSFGYNFFLDFLKDDHTRRIAYAPSLGKESWNAPADKEAKVRSLLLKFDAISVREDTSIEILKEKFGVDSTLVVDPTMLLTSEDYMHVFNITQKKEKAHIAAYILDYDEQYRSVLRHISDELALPLNIIAVKKPHGRVGKMLSRFMPMSGVVEWVRNIATADFVVTNSFHGMVFSIIFRKQFLVFMNSERGSARFTSLLKMFGLQDRLVDISDDKYMNVLGKYIDYSGDIEASLAKWRKHSEEYLHNSLR